MLKNLRKYLRTHHVIALLGLIVLVVAIMQYSGAKNGSKDGFGGGAGYRRSGDPRFQEPTAAQQQQVWGAADAAAARPAQPMGQTKCSRRRKVLAPPLWVSHQAALRVPQLTQRSFFPRTTTANGVLSTQLGAATLRT